LASCLIILSRNVQGVKIYLYVYLKETSVIPKKDICLCSSKKILEGKYRIEWEKSMNNVGIFLFNDIELYGVW
jgi:hypothetical protein